MNSTTKTPLQKILSFGEHIARQRNQILPAARRRVYMSFVRLRTGWHCRFHQNDLPKTPISRQFVFSSAQKIYEAAQRGDGLVGIVSRDALDDAVAIGRGGLWLHLTDNQYSALLKSRPLPPNN